jgi:catechol 2,3-dioxygenase-like lactoylglutathione lyase family enzyme
MPELIAVYPISNEDTTALPVKTLDQAIAFYKNILGFSVVRRDTTTATIARDDVQLGLTVRSDHNPARAGSVAFEVDDLDAMHDELERTGGCPGAFGVDQWGGRSHRTFFVREDENGYCYCFYHPLEAATT